MSRCFPFPTPGYNKKARIEDTVLLTKCYIQEKHKEKKHKKDRKDKEKREGSKEKKNKDKEKSKEKHSDKKDRKEKHRDKKDRHKDKDKSRTSDAKRIKGQQECNNGDKLGPNSLQNTEISDFKYVQDLARRTRDDDRATGSQIGQKITVTDPRREGFPGRMVECCIDNRLEEEKANDRKENDRKVNGQRNHVQVKGQKNHVEVRSFGNAIVPGLPGIDKKKIQGIAKSVEKNGIEVVEKEKNKHKDRDREEKSRSKDENLDKEKKKEKKAKEVSETSEDQIKRKDSSLKLKDGSPKLKHSNPQFRHSSPQLKHSSSELKDSSKVVLKTNCDNPALEANLGKRKELEINGISHDNGTRPNKLPRPVSSSHQAVEKGKKLEPCHSAVPFKSEWQGEVHNCKVDMKEYKINGLMEVPKPIVDSSRHLSNKAGVSENGEASVKPPHPDSKYLNQILSVPKLEDCSDDLDDQEWLLNSDCMHSKKPKLDPPKIDGTQVWAEALRIECADLTALPYVIPF